MKIKETKELIQIEKVIIIGAGTSGYFLTFELLKKGIAVDLYELTGGALKKFLIAGKGGLNLTHSDNKPQFVSKFGKNKRYFETLISHFSNDDLRKWFAELGIETYIGSSKRVFPKDKTAGEILRIWIDKCHTYENFNFHPKYRLIDFNNGLIVKKDKGEVLNLGSENIVMALGGASYKNTGSNGDWVKIINKMNIKLREFSPVNCGFEVDWKEGFVEKVSHQPLKNILIKCEEIQFRGEILLTSYGVEGSGIYALSRQINNIILENNYCQLEVDLKPDINLEDIKLKLARHRNKSSFTNFLRKTLNLDLATMELLKSTSTKTQFNDVDKLALLIKACPIRLERARPIDEAISTAGGILFEEVNIDLSLKKYPGIYIMGEMLDWDAQTGGYLFQGCFSMASWIASQFTLKK
ncbi:MAG: TIGR03862 family flavoprotein [Bacteriovoracaceae bacterium]|jgi:uncharacterized flavoprotein (TIGR03862 family)|nr:TIGR03862 family flavoprotein [Bacteriovoracaceae bacterium]